MALYYRRAFHSEAVDLPGLDAFEVDNTQAEQAIEVFRKYEGMAPTINPQEGKTYPQMRRRVSKSALNLLHSAPSIDISRTSMRHALLSGNWSDRSGWILRPSALVRMAPSVRYLDRRGSCRYLTATAQRWSLMCLALADCTSSSRSC